MGGGRLECGVYRRTLDRYWKYVMLGLRGIRGWGMVAVTSGVRGWGDDCYFSFSIRFSNSLVRVWTVYCCILLFILFEYPNHSY